MVLSFLKSRLFGIFLLAGIAAYIFFSVRTCNRQTETISRLKTNQVTYATGKGEGLVKLTAREFRACEQGIVKILLKHGIRAKDVHYTTVTNYVYKDRIVTEIDTFWRDPVTDNQVLEFWHDSACFNIYGQINTGTGRVILEPIFNDTIITALYMKFRHKFWFIRWGREYSGISISGCRGDTLSVLKNIEVIE